MKNHLFYLLLTLSCTELHAFGPAISSGNPDNNTKAPLKLKVARPNALPNPITSSVTIYASDISGTTWPVTISGGISGNPVVVTLASDITLTDFSNYFIIASEYVTFDGNNHTVTISTGGNPYSGLFKNGSWNFVPNGYSNVTIKNIVLFNFDANLSNAMGWIGQDGFGFNATNVIIDNCHTSWPGSIGTNAGGIVGRTSPATVTNCSSTGTIPSGGGGICGKFFSGSVINCHSNGVVGINAGGITGSFCTGTALNCYSTGNISGLSSGGIMGSDAGNNNGAGIIPATATNCYSTGNISGSNGGGIMSQKFNGNVINCYSTGNITGSNAGGIVGYLSPGNVTNCYSICTESSGTRGITGTSFSGTISNCISNYTGIWSDAEASSVLTGTDGTVWTDVDLSSSNVLFKLTAFNAAIYTPSIENQLNGPVVYSPPGNFSSGTYSIISLNDAYPTLGININSGDGTLSFNNPGLGSYVASVLHTGGVNGSYEINSYTLNIAAVVPLTWLSFDVRAKGPSAMLSWSTASEQNTENFEVQHGLNGHTWNTIGTVVAKGNSNVTTTYNYSDRNPVNGNNYYRLKQTDIDGKFSYSMVRNLNMVLNKRIFSLLNNPVSNSVLQVNVQAPTTLILYKSDGSILWKKQFNAGIQNISLHEVSKGMYFLVGGDVVERLIVQ